MLVTHYLTYTEESILKSTNLLAYQIDYYLKHLRAENLWVMQIEHAEPNDHDRIYGVRRIKFISLPLPNPNVRLAENNINPTLP